MLTRYCWYEYHLVGPSGEQATLIYEPEGSGPQWQLFTRFEPESPLSAEEARAKRRGEAINLGGTEALITFKGVSKVRASEGEIPEGYQEGEEDNFFNAQGGSEELVMNWRGEKVDFYRGTFVSYAVIRTAFHLCGPTPGKLRMSWGDESSESNTADRLKWIAIVLLSGAVLAGFWFWPTVPKPPRLIKANPAVLSLGTEVPLDGRMFRIQSRCLVEVDQVGLRYERHEYQLAAADGNTGLLVQGVNPGGKEWTLYQPFEPLTPLTPQQAAAKSVGDPIGLDENNVKVAQLFRVQVQRTEMAEAGENSSQHFYYGFSGSAGYYSVMARWDEHGILFYRGHSAEIRVGPGNSR